MDAEKIVTCKCGKPGVFRVDTATRTGVVCADCAPPEFNAAPSDQHEFPWVVALNPNDENSPAKIVGKITRVK